jgi:hypothetical protein
MCKIEKKVDARLRMNLPVEPRGSAREANIWRPTGLSFVTVPCIGINVACIKLTCS